MEKRGKSSLQKASIAMTIAFIVGVLCIAEIASARVTPVDVEVKNDDELVSVREDFKTIATRGLTIVAKTIDIEMFVGQIAEIEFDTSADFADAIVIDEKGKIIGSYEFARGIGDIEFSAGETRTVIILSPGDDDNYGNNGGRQQFLRECEGYNTKTKAQIIDIILGNSIEIAGSGDTAGVIVVKTKIVQPEITDISGEWDEYELEITGQSNLPRRTEIEWRIFGETGVAKAKRNGKINFDIDLEGIDTSGNCVIEMLIGNCFEEFELDSAPAPTEPIMSIKPKSSPTPTPKSTPTTEVTRVLADPPESVKEPVKEAVMEAQRAQAELAEKSRLTKILETEVKWLPEIAAFTIVIVALLILRKKMKK